MSGQRPEPGLAAQQPPTLNVQGLKVSLGGRQVLSDVGFSIQPGAWLALVGPNGGGKSTVLRSVAGLLPYAGSVQLQGADARTLDRRTRARILGYVPQTPAVPAMTVAAYVMLGRTPHGSLLRQPGAADRAQVAECLKLLDLSELARRPLPTLSGGERQRAVLARALAQEADLLILDEPTSALDLGHAQQVLELIDELRCERGLSVLTSVHDLTLASQYADELALVVDGRVVAAGTPEQVLTSKRLAQYYGAKADVISEDGDLWVRPRRRRPHGLVDDHG